MIEVMRRSAADNAYLHKDFHGALSTALFYLEEAYGAEAVREYLRQFAATFYAGLTRAITARGLVALQEHFEGIYRIEGGDVTYSLGTDELLMQVAACPAVTHMRKMGQAVSPLFYETTKTVNETICKGTPFTAELLAYDQETGRSTVRFARRQP